MFGVLVLPVPSDDAGSGFVGATARFARLRDSVGMSVPVVVALGVTTVAVPRVIVGAVRELLVDRADVVLHEGVVHNRVQLSKYEAQ